jgi:predicted O-methyltransferase YrrM
MNQKEIINYTERTMLETNEVMTARDFAKEYNEPVPSKLVCSFLQNYALGKKQIVEVDTSFGIVLSYLNLNRAEITSIDSESEKQKVANDMLIAQKILTPQNKPNLRFINSEPNLVFDKMAENTYDLIFFNSYNPNYNYKKATNALNGDGSLIINDILLNGKAMDPSNRENKVVEIRDFVDKLESDEDIYFSILPINEAILIISKR